jgi:hypothetical protein
MQSQELIQAPGMNMVFPHFTRMRFKMRRICDTGNTMRQCKSLNDPVATQFGASRHLSFFCSIGASQCQRVIQSWQNTIHAGESFRSLFPQSLIS